MINTLLLTGLMCLSAGKGQEPIFSKMKYESTELVNHVVENYSFYDERFDPISVFKQELFEKELMFDLVNKEEAEYYQKALDYDKSFKYVEGLETYFVKDKSVLAKTSDKSKEYLCSLKTFNDLYGDKEETTFFEVEEEAKPVEDVYDLGDGICLPKYAFEEEMVAVRVNGKTKSGPLIGIQANRDACIAVYDAVNTAKSFLATGNPGLYGTLFGAIAGFAAAKAALSSLIASVVAKIGSAASAIINVLLSSPIGFILGLIVLIAVVAVIAVLVGMYICGSKGYGFVIGLIANGWPWEWEPICDYILL